MTTAARERTDRPAGPPLRRNRDFRLLWVGQALSDFGSAMTYVVLPLVLLSSGYSTSVTGTIGTATLVVALAVRVPAGYLADRYDQRRLMLGCDLVRLALVGTVAVTAFRGHLPITLALGSVIVCQAGREVFQPSQSRVVRRLVPKDQLPTAVTLNQVRSYTAAIAAPAAAGLLLSFQHGVPFAVDAATFGVSALCVAGLSRARIAAAAPAAARTHTDGGFLARVTAGLRYVRHSRFLGVTAAYFAVLNLAYQALVYTLILGVGRQAGGDGTVGVAMSAAAVAGLAGALVTPLVRRRLSLPVVAAVGPTLGAVLLAVAWLSGATYAFVAAFAALCLLTPVIGAVLAIVMVATVPEDIYGRVTTATGFTGELLQPFGPLAAGLLLSALSLAGTAAVLSGVFLLLAVLALALPPAPGQAPGAAPGAR